MWQILIAGLLSARCYAQLWVDSLEIRQGVWPGDGAGLSQAPDRAWAELKF